MFFMIVAYIEKRPLTQDLSHLINLVYNENRIMNRRGEVRLLLYVLRFRYVVG